MNHSSRDRFKRQDKLWTDGAQTPANDNSYIITFSIRQEKVIGLRTQVELLPPENKNEREALFRDKVNVGGGVFYNRCQMVVGKGLMDEDPRKIEQERPFSVSGAVSPATHSALEHAQLQTPARILAGRAGSGYRTATWIGLRSDHAAAKDAVFAQLDLVDDLGKAFVAHWGLFEVATQALTKNEYLLRPDLGRLLSAKARTELASRCPAGVDFQVAISDGLSAIAVRAQVPDLLPLLSVQAHQRGWRFGQPFLIRHGRVGVLNEIGETLDPTVVVLLIGERPGLAMAESLSAYMAYRPRAGHDDSRRNLISNIHARGITFEQAADRIARLAEQMIALGTSGVCVKEQGLINVAPEATGG